MPTVYVSQEAPTFRKGGEQVAKDLSSAARHGSIRFVYPRTCWPSTDPDFARKVADNVLTAFDPEVDFLCYAGGDPLALALAVSALHRRGIAGFRYLRWDRERDPAGNRTGMGFYVPVQVKIGADR